MGNTAIFWGLGLVENYNLTPKGYYFYGLLKRNKNEFNIISSNAGKFFMINVTETCIVYKKESKMWRLLKDEERECLNKKCKPSAFELPNNHKEIINKLNYDYSMIHTKTSLHSFV